MLHYSASGYDLWHVLQNNGLNKLSAVINNKEDVFTIGSPLSFVFDVSPCPESAGDFPPSCCPQPPEKIIEYENYAQLSRLSFADNAEFTL